MFCAVGLWLLLAGEPGWSPELKFAPGERLTYVETLQGQGELTRLQGGERRVELTAEAECRRRWTIEERTATGYRLRAESLAGQQTLRLGAAIYEEIRPWRGFLLDVSAGGGIEQATELPADPVEPRPPADEPNRFTELPFDLDLGEIFSLLELGLLPPRALAVGEEWSVGEEGGEALYVKGRLLDLVTEGAERVAVLETTFTTPVPPRATPLTDVLVTGALGGRMRVRFYGGAGRVVSAQGPLDLRLEFKLRQRDERVAVVRLRFDLATRLVER